VGKIVEQHRISTMQEAVQELLVLARAWASSSEVAAQGSADYQASGIEEVEWRIKSIDFQDALRERDSRVQRLEHMVCVECPDFDEHVSPAYVSHACALLKARASTRRYIGRGRSKVRLHNSSFS
jgi:hypothetical protein